MYVVIALMIEKITPYYENEFRIQITTIIPTINFIFVLTQIYVSFGIRSSLRTLKCALDLGK